MNDIFTDEPFIRRAAPQPEWRVREYMAFETEMQKRQSVWAFWFRRKSTLLQRVLFETRGADLFICYPDTRLEVEVLNVERHGAIPIAIVMWAVIPGYWEGRRGMLINGPHAKMFFDRAA